MMRHALSSLALTAVCVMPASVDAAIHRAGTPNVQFNATGPGGLRIAGVTHDLDLREEGDKLVVSVALANLDTGIELRNRHMREKYLEIGKYPRAELTVVRSQVTGSTPRADASGEADGTMLMHGVSHPVRFRYSAKYDENGTHVTGSVHVDMTDYGIAKPGYLGVSVKPEVDVDVAFDAKE